MAIYFSGRRHVGSITLRPQKSAILQCEIYVKWEDIDLSSTARCGATGSIQVTKEVGLSARDQHALSANVGASIGLEGVAQLKSEVEARIEREVTWSETQSVTQAFTFEVGKCGRRSETVYQMVREYELSYQRYGLFGTESWERTLKERTRCLDLVPGIEYWDEACKCPKADVPRYDGRMQLDMGDISMRVAFRHIPEGIEIHFGDKVGVFPLKALHGFHGKLPADYLPDVLKFLGGIKSGYVECAFSLYQDPLPLAFSKLAPDLLGPADELVELLQLSDDKMLDR